MILLLYNKLSDLYTIYNLSSQDIYKGIEELNLREKKLERILKKIPQDKTS